MTHWCRPLKFILTFTFIKLKFLIEWTQNVKLRILHDVNKHLAYFKIDSYDDPQGEKRW